MIATAIALPVALVVGVVVAAVFAQRTPAIAPVALASAPAPDSGSAACATLLSSLPDVLGDARRAALVSPVPAGTAAWRTDDETADPLILRCGTPRPAEFTAAAALIAVNGVKFLEIRGAKQGPSATSYVDVDRGVYITLTLPNGAGSGSVQQLAELIAAKLPAKPLDPEPVGG
ncbi:MAG: DUF3515 domain-containing protein [Mycobacteriaceae bacterium]